MLKLLLHITLAVALLTQQVGMLVVCVAFKMEQNHLIQTACINRDNPNSKCKAHCQLSKRIDEQERQEQQNRIPLKEQTEYTAHFEAFSMKALRPEPEQRIWRKGNDERLLDCIAPALIQPPGQSV